MKKIADIISSQLAVIVLVVAVAGLVFPPSFSWISPNSINELLGIIMCGMGLNLRLHDFKVVFTRPKDVITGAVAQFTIMPFLAWLLTVIFRPSPELAIGIVLVGCCPGGTSSNVITYLAKGDLALSVGMTCVTTLLAPVMTPLLAWIIIGRFADVDMLAMLLSIVQVVIIPIVIGLLLQHYLPKVTKHVTAYLPAVSTLAIAAIVGCVISNNASRLLETSLMIAVIVILHNVLGYVFGFLLGKALHLSRPKLTALSVEVGMQNSGLATSLATVHFAAYPLSTVPGAIFSVWHNFSGALLASFVKRVGDKNHSM